MHGCTDNYHQITLMLKKTNNLKYITTLWQVLHVFFKGRHLPVTTKWIYGHLIATDISGTVSLNANRGTLCVLSVLKWSNNLHELCDYVDNWAKSVGTNCNGKLLTGFRTPSWDCPRHLRPCPCLLCPPPASQCENLCRALFLDCVQAVPQLRGCILWSLHFKPQHVTMTQQDWPECSKNTPFFHNSTSHDCEAPVASSGARNDAAVKSL